MSKIALGMSTWNPVDKFLDLWMASDISKAPCQYRTYRKSYTTMAENDRRKGHQVRHDLGPITWQKIASFVGRRRFEIWDIRHWWIVIHFSSSLFLSFFLSQRRRDEFKPYACCMRCLFTANFTVSQWTTTPGWNFTNSKLNIFCFVLFWF